MHGTNHEARPSFHDAIESPISEFSDVLSGSFEAEKQAILRTCPFSSFETPTSLTRCLANPPSPEPERELHTRLSHRNHKLPAILSFARP